MPAVGALEVSAFTVPTASPESDGTAEWNATTLVLVEIEAGGQRGLGYTYADLATARLIKDVLAQHVVAHDAFDTPAIWSAMVRALRNHGRGGVCAMAISAVDNAAWDLKSKLLSQPLSRLLGQVRDSVPVYGSGGFTSYSQAELEEQLSGWAARGFGMVKMKVGREPGNDTARVRVARNAIGPGVALFVDANGAYQRKQALELAQTFASLGVRWFEEPVIKTDLTGLRLLRDRAPPGMEVSGGEYGYELADFRAFIEAGALDVIQADVTRCGGVTGFLEAAALCEAFELPMSSHCAPALHVPLGCHLRQLRHLEYFFDHQRIERILFDGLPEPDHGQLRPDASRWGFGLTLKRQDAERYQVRF
jgi:L-alanine-DL-glutamate epimerase-like enolase superfamily enzyme